MEALPETASVPINTINEKVERDVFKKIEENSSYKGTEHEVENSSNSLFHKEENEPVVILPKQLCANYRSDSDSDSIDSESDSSTTSNTSSEDSDSDTSSVDSTTKTYKTKKKNGVKKNQNDDLSVNDLPPIENLQISVPEKDCVEIGVVSGIIGTLVVIESYKDSAPLDIDTVLFLDLGRETLGKVFEILGPIYEPVYAVRFNNEEEIHSKKITKGIKVYYAPKTEHTTFVFLNNVLKNKGTDASWKDNVEAPSEFQDFSDDEEECRFKNNLSNQEVQSTSGNSNSFQRIRKRSFADSVHTQSRTNGNANAMGVIRPNRFQYRPTTNFYPPPQTSYHPSQTSYQPPQTSYHPPQTSYHPPQTSYHPPQTSYHPPQTSYHPPHSMWSNFNYNQPNSCFNNPFHSSPFPFFGTFPNSNFSQRVPSPFFQQRTRPFYQQPHRHSLPTNMVPFFSRPPPPPPPPPPSNGQR